MQPIEETLLAHRTQLLRYITRQVGDEQTAEDVLQEGLLRALRSAGDLRDEERLLPWFYRVLRNAVIDTYRQRGTEEKHMEAYQRSEALELSAAEEAELCACLRGVLPSIKPEYRQVIERLDFAEGSPQQVAQELGISPRNLAVRRHRARQALRTRLEETCRTCARHGCLDCTCQLDEH